MGGKIYDALHPSPYFTYLTHHWPGVFYLKHTFRGGFPPFIHPPLCSMTYSKGLMLKWWKGPGRWPKRWLKKAPWPLHLPSAGFIFCLICMWFTHFILIYAAVSSSSEGPSLTIPCKIAALLPCNFLFLPSTLHCLALCYGLVYCPSPPLVCKYSEGPDCVYLIFCCFTSN